MQRPQCSSASGVRGRPRCSSQRPADRPGAAAKQYKIGYSNGGGVGNGFREEQVCTAKAQALASGQVSEPDRDPPQHRRRRPASDIRDLIAKASTRSSSTRTTRRPSTRPSHEAKAAGIKTVSVDAYVTDPNTYNLYNNQVKYAELGAKWLFEQLGGKGTV